MSQPQILVTGDVVLDSHLYGGVKTVATSFSEPGTRYTQQLGGAVLTCNLLKAAADAKGLAWDVENAKRARNEGVPQPGPDALAIGRPQVPYDVILGLDVTGLEAALPSHLRSYGVWIERPAKKDAKERVWRTGPSFGYGPTEPVPPSGIFKRAAAASGVVPVLTLIDDGGILFRQAVSKNAWPALGGTKDGWYLLKMSWPLCRGDLWAALDPVMDRLVVVVSAADIRREDVQLNSRLSWEQCVEHTIQALHQDPVAGDLLRAAHVVISYESEGALWYERDTDKGGARQQGPVWRLFFSHDALEGDLARQFDGTTYGFQTSFVTGIAHQLMASHAAATTPGNPSPLSDRRTMRRAIERGVGAGLATRRLLLELGHGPVGKSSPEIPVTRLGRCAADAADKAGGFVLVEVPAAVPETLRAGSSCQWTILRQAESGTTAPAGVAAPMTGLAHLTALYGPGALSAVPALRMGNLLTVDRSEIESLRTLESLIGAYEGGGVQNKPLSIGVFGPPGAGKSFGVKALAKAVLGDKSRFLEFNLSQFKGPDELIGAFHRVRDAVLGGITPVAFWDEFDSQQYRWLQYLLAPMQDGAFQEGQITHPIGKCVFIFAGGTSASLEEFGVTKPGTLDERALAKLRSGEREERRRAWRELNDRYRDYVLLKGPDFVSRLHGFLNVLGPNAREAGSCPDISWPVRRAIILRGILGLKQDEILDIDLGLLNALLAVPAYRHGARSFEKIVKALDQGRRFGRLNRSALPPMPLLDRETDAGTFRALLRAGDECKRPLDLEALAMLIHGSFLSEAKKSLQPAPPAGVPMRPWDIHPSIQKSYADLDDDKKASNRGAARRIPDHLALIGYVVQARGRGSVRTWRKPLEDAIERHLERLALAEHLGWCAERRANGWSYDPVRDDTLKHHPLLVDWSDLSEASKDKDRSSVRAIPDRLVAVGFKAVPIQAAR
jgi:hypothetical protein